MKPAGNKHKQAGEKYSVLQVNPRRKSGKSGCLPIVFFCRTTSLYHYKMENDLYRILQMRRI
jgi:hypothetical protein